MTGRLAGKSKPWPAPAGYAQDWRTERAPDAEVLAVQPGDRHVACVEHVGLQGLASPLCILKGTTREQAVAAARELGAGRVIWARRVPGR